MAETLLTIPQVAAALQVHRSSVYRYIADGMLTTVDIGRKRPKTRVRQAALDKFIRELERAA